MHTLRRRREITAYISRLHCDIERSIAAAETAAIGSRTV